MGLQRHQVVIAALLAIGAVGFLVVSGMRDTMVFYYTVSEVMAPDSSVSGPLRVAGKVVPGTIEVSNDNHLQRAFTIHEGGRELRVEYHGITPDTLVDDADAVVEGQLGDDGVFHATHVMAKCPSKYEDETDFAKYRQAQAGVEETTP